MKSIEELSADHLMSLIPAEIQTHLADPSTGELVTGASSFTVVKGADNTVVQLPGLVQLMNPFLEAVAQSQGIALAEAEELDVQMGHWKVQAGGLLLNNVIIDFRRS